MQNVSPLPTAAVRRFLARAALLLLAMAATAAVATACPNCKDALAENTTDQAQLAQGYFWSILLMMSMPFAILGVFSGGMYLSIRRARREPAASPFQDLSK